MPIGPGYICGVLGRGTLKQQRIQERLLLQYVYMHTAVEVLSPVESPR